MNELAYQEILPQDIPHHIAFNDDTKEQLSFKNLVGGMVQITYFYTNNLVAILELNPRTNQVTLKSNKAFTIIEEGILF